MSKERAIRRAAREAEAAAARVAQERAAARRAKRRSAYGALYMAPCGWATLRRRGLRYAAARVLRSITPRLPDGRVGKLYPRRSYGERVMIALAAVVATALIWMYVTGIATRIALTATLLVAAPAIIVIAFGRRSR